MKLSKSIGQLKINLAASQLILNQVRSTNGGVFTNAVEGPLRLHCL